MGSKGDII
jgi:hypothetical protein